jgi:shikimate kinase
LASNGRVVYLKTTIDEQVRRTNRDKKRPLLNTGNPRDILSKLMDERDPLYQEVSDYIVITDSRSPKAVALEIRDMLNA